MFSLASYHVKIPTNIKRRCYLESLELAHTLVDAIVDKKGSDIILLDIRDYASFADYFLIGNGENERQLKTLAEEIAQKAKKNAGANALGIEGLASAGWVLIDFGDLVVHLFSPQKRDYYGLEDIWDDAHVVMRMH